MISEATAAPTNASRPAPRRAPLWLDPEEADAFLSVLMTAPPVQNVCPRMADRLMFRVATVRRVLLRRAAGAPDQRRRARRACRARCPRPVAG